MNIMQKKLLCGTAGLVCLCSTALVPEEYHRGDISGMVNETVTEGSITYTYNAWNQLVSEKHNGNTSDYTYDKSGAISGIQGDKDITYIYDAKGRLTRYTTKENGITATTEYTYDYRGTRTSKTVDGKETRYITYSMNGLSYVLYFFLLEVFVLPCRPFLQHLRWITVCTSPVSLCRQC